MLVSEFKIGQLIYETFLKEYYIPLSFLSNNDLRDPHSLGDVVVWSVTQNKIDKYIVSSSTINSDILICDVPC